MPPRDHDFMHLFPLPIEYLHRAQRAFRRLHKSSDIANLTLDRQNPIRRSLEDALLNLSPERRNRQKKKRKRGRVNPRSGLENSETEMAMWETDGFGKGESVGLFGAFRNGSARNVPFFSYYPNRKETWSEIGPAFVSGGLVLLILYI